MSGVGDIKVDLEKLILRLLIKLPETENDENYHREFFRTSIDVTKFFREINRISFISKAIMESVKNSLDFKMQFPMKKVLGFYMFRHLIVFDCRESIGGTTSPSWTTSCPFLLAQNSLRNSHWWGNFLVVVLL
jgi:hypothetical protein